MFTRKVGDFLETECEAILLQEGDKNSRFFHKFASARKYNNSIKKILDVSGEWKDLQMIKNYDYQLLLRSVYVRRKR